MNKEINDKINQVKKDIDSYNKLLLEYERENSTIRSRIKRDFKKEDLNHIINLSWINNVLELRWSLNQIKNDNLLRLLICTTSNNERINYYNNRITELQSQLKKLQFQLHQLKKFGRIL